MNCIHSYDYEVKCLLELRNKTKYGGAVAYILSPSNKLFGNFFFGKVMLETILLAAISIYTCIHISISIFINQNHFVRWTWLNTQSTSMSATKMLRCALSEISFSSRGFELVEWFCWKNICSTESLSGYIYGLCTQSLLQGKIENKIRHKSKTTLIQRSVFLILKSPQWDAGILPPWQPWTRISHPAPLWLEASAEEWAPS